MSIKIVTVANQKGGVAKTTTARHLVHALIERGLRVLVVDLDGQRNLTTTFGEGDMPPNVLTSLDLFNESVSRKSIWRLSEKLAVIPATRELTDVGELPLPVIFHPKVHLTALASEFDFCVIDTAPALGKPLFGALIASNYVICPCDMCDDSISGITDLFGDIEVVKNRQEWNSDLVNLGLLASRVNKNRAFDLAALKQCREALGELMLDSVVWDRPATKLARKNPVWRLAGGGEARTKAAQEMKSAMDEILRKMGV